VQLYFIVSKELNALAVTVPGDIPLLNLATKNWKKTSALDRAGFMSRQAAMDATRRAAADFISRTAPPAGCLQRRGPRPPVAGFKFQPIGHRLKPDLIGILIKTSRRLATPGGIYCHRLNNIADL
jgi:hypothetical protein